jgi:hypothetical protein
MIQERTSQDDDMEAPRSFPVPRNRPVLTPVEEPEESEVDQPAWQRRAWGILLMVALVAAGAAGWLISQPVEQAVPAPRAVESRVPSDDPAVEVYFTPSRPEVPPPLVEDSTPLPVQPVSLDELFGKEER